MRISTRCFGCFNRGSHLALNAARLRSTQQGPYLPTIPESGIAAGVGFRAKGGQDCLGGYAEGKRNAYAAAAPLFAPLS